MYRKEYMKEYYSRPEVRERTNKRIRLYYKNHPEKTSSSKLRRKIFMILDSFVCVRCGFDDPRALQIDHKNGGGVAEVKKHGSMIAMYSYYINNELEAKEKLQILCANCNWIKRSENKELNTYTY